MEHLRAHNHMAEMTEIRCKKCNRLLMKGSLIEGEIKCPKCKYLNSFEFAIKETLFKGEYGTYENVRIVTNK